MPVTDQDAHRGLNLTVDGVDDEDIRDAVLPQPRKPR
jgi:hypothetical protein